MEEETAWDGIDVSPLRRLGSDSLIQVLDSLTCPKTLLIDPTLAGPLGKICDVNALRQHGVEKMFWLEYADGTNPRPIHAPTRQLLYLCRPETRWMETLAAHYEANTRVQNESDAHSFAIAFVPYRTEPCLQYLRKRNLVSQIQVYDLPLEFHVLSPDLLSLEESQAVRDIFYLQDQTILFRSAQALMTMQSTFGLFPRIIGKGDMANRLCDLLVRQRREQYASNQSSAALQSVSPQIEALVVLDRDIDLITPFSTQLTYEGLIDEVIGVENGLVEVDASWVGTNPTSGPNRLSSSSNTAKKQLALDESDDGLFASIKDANFAVVGEKLHSIAKRINQGYQGRYGANTVDELRAFVGKLGSLQSEHASLRLHTHIVEQLLCATNSERFHSVLEIQQNLISQIQIRQQLSAIEELIYLQTPIMTVLRLACLACAVGAPIKANWLENFKSLIVQTYGFQYLPLLIALEKLHWLNVAVASKSTRTTRFADLQRALRLVDDDVNEVSPCDISYVFSGYAPLSIRLVQSICQHNESVRLGKAAPDPTRDAPKIAGWRNADGVIVHWPGALFDFVQEAEQGAISDDQVKTVVVFFVGGVTYAEIAALRLMSKQQRNRRFLVATTSIINGNSLLRQLN
ncbi:Vacuolar protein-sorting-associated protein 33 [Malassezia yamatoensis]|uniref:Vacuolar protein-sorting-associated protein 33 n=1 Tax=Malassezia yamatoensis TaxID=253288 RepID=A0AAJ5YXR7_9BASI|nr:Vacuolar protein-sorting-associated protein 33 [Malassezia yamatoensis]